MTIKKFALFTALGILATFLALEETSWAAAVRNASAPIDPKMDVRAWTNPLDGADYAMKPFDDGATVAIRYHQELNESKGFYEGRPDVLLEPPQRRGLADVYAARPDQWQVVHDMWKERKLSCAVRRSVPDLFGNLFSICQTAPFKFQVGGWTLSLPANGVVWIITPPASGKQEPARRSNRPGWGR